MSDLEKLATILACVRAELMADVELPKRLDLMNEDELAIAGIACRYCAALTFIERVISDPTSLPIATV